MLLTKQNEYRKQLTKNEGFPPNSPDKAPMLDLLAELGRDPATLRVLVDIRSLPDPRYDDAQWGRVREVAQVLVLAAAELDQVFRERGAVDFPTVSMAAVRALGSADAPTDLSLRLDYRLQHILVDEFQDTSGAQLELVKLLTSGWPRYEPFWNSPRKASVRCGSTSPGCAVISVPIKTWSSGSILVFPAFCRVVMIDKEALSHFDPARRHDGPRTTTASRPTPG
jgi:superfamily I DNA/RNA helicase